MEVVKHSNTPVIGIIGGGQLGMMLIKYGIRLIAPNAVVRVLDNSNYSSCSRLPGVEMIKGSITDENDLRTLCQGCDVVTWEIEHINIEALMTLKDEGVHFIPDPAVLAVIQNKGVQKMFYKSSRIHTAPFCITNTPRAQWDVLSHRTPMFECDAFRSATVVYKDTMNGYDGRGVRVVTEPGDDQTEERQTVVEPFIDDKIEISVIVAVDSSLQTYSYEPVQMVFLNSPNILYECHPIVSGINESDENKL